jgi:hypothetical protein
VAWASFKFCTPAVFGPAISTPAIHARSVDPAIEHIIERAQAGNRLHLPEIVRLFDLIR